jgi:hypothetical protein
MADPVSPAPHEQTILLEQWKGAVTLVVAFATKRLTALSVGATIVAILATLSATIQPFFPVLGAAAVMVVVALAFRLVVYSLNQATRVFMAECGRIERVLKLPAFASYHQTFLEKNKSSTGTFAFYWATLAVTWAAVAAGLGVVWWRADNNAAHQDWATGYTVVALLVSLVLEGVYYSRWWRAPVYPDPNDPTCPKATDAG